MPLSAVYLFNFEYCLGPYEWLWIAIIVLTAAMSSLSRLLMLRLWSVLFVTSMVWFVLKILRRRADRLLACIIVSLLVYGLTLLTITIVHALIVVMRPLKLLWLLPSLSLFPYVFRSVDLGHFKDNFTLAFQLAISKCLMGISLWLRGWIGCWSWVLLLMLFYLLSIEYDGRLSLDWTLEETRRPFWILASFVLRWMSLRWYAIHSQWAMLHM